MGNLVFSYYFHRPPSIFRDYCIKYNKNFWPKTYILIFPCKYLFVKGFRKIELFLNLCVSSLSKALLIFSVSFQFDRRSRRDKLQVPYYIVYVLWFE